MKLSVFLLLVICFQSSAESYSQQVTLSERNAPLEKVFKSIKKQTDYVFFFDYSWLDQAKPVNINIKNLPLEQALNLCFKNQPLTYSVVGKTVVIRPKENRTNQDTTIRVTGTVTDNQGNPLIGVSIKVKDMAGWGITTDNNGKYSLTIPDQSTLVFTYIGFETISVPVNGRRIVDVVMKEDMAELNEVVVIGYGSTTKKDLTGSVGQVKIEDLTKAPVFTFTDALAGRVAGVQVSSNDGQPGSQQNIVIRGSGSLTQNTDPLYVIDGFAMENFNSNILNPNDIESITVLKDASSTAIYGSRGSNGVIVIQTKKGKTGKPEVSFSTSLGIQELRKQMEMMSPYEFVKMQSEMTNSALVAQSYFTNGKTLDSYKNAEGINWQDLIFRRGTMQTYDLAVRGGSEQTRYSVSGVINDQDALMINSGYSRYIGRFSLDQNINDKIKVGVNANYSDAKSFGVAAASNTGTSAISNYIFANVYGYRPVTGDAVNLVEEQFDPAVNVDVSNVRINPVITAQNIHRLSKISDLTANAYFSYSISKNLILNIRAGNRKRVTRGEGFYNSLTPQGSATPANSRGVNGNISFAENNTWTNDNTLTYKKTFNKDHNLTVLGGFSLEGVNTDNYGANVQHLPNEQLGLLGLDEGTPYAVSASAGASSIMSFFNRLSYNYKSKYLLDFTMRADGSSKFSEGRRWGYFPAAAIAWNMSEESFMKAVPFISNSKLRVSYGTIGNNRIGYYDTHNRISFDDGVNGVSFNNQTPVTSAWLNELGNIELQWESTAHTNIGYDIGLFKNRVELTAEVYKRVTNKLLLDAQIPYFTGYSSAVKNIGKLQNQGLEITLNTTNIKTPAFIWQSNFNISFNKSKILELTELSTLFSSVSFTPAPNLWAATVGQPISLFHGYVFDGVYQYDDFDNPQPGVYQLKNSITTNGDTRASIRPGDIKYKDLNGDLVVNAFDQTIIGRAEPIHTGGFSNNFSYKGLSLNVFFQWSYGNDIFNGNRLVFEGNSQYSYHTNQFASWANRWTPENPSNEYFRVGGEGPTARGSSRVIEDGSYLRLKTISLGYQVPQKFIKKLHLSNLSINASAQNLLTWTKYSGLDPEVSIRNSALTQGFDYSAYPHAQTIVLGLKTTF